MPFISSVESAPKLSQRPRPQQSTSTQEIHNAVTLGVAMSTSTISFDPHHLDFQGAQEKRLGTASGTTRVRSDHGHDDFKNSNRIDRESNVVEDWNRQAKAHAEDSDYLDNSEFKSSMNRQVHFGQNQEETNEYDEENDYKRPQTCPEISTSSKNQRMQSGKSGKMNSSKSSSQFSDKFVDHYDDHGYGADLVGHAGKSHGHHQQHQHQHQHQQPYQQSQAHPIAGHNKPHFFHQLSRIESRSDNNGSTSSDSLAASFNHTNNTSFYGSLL